MGSTSTHPSLHIAVTDTDQRVGLYAAQVLGRLGHRISATHLSRTPSSRFIESSSYVAHSGLATWLRELHARDPLDAILPVSINAVSSLADADLSGLPQCLSFERPLLDVLNDKLKVCEAARACGVRAPKTLVVSELSGLEPTIKEMGFPVVAKLRNDIGTYLAPKERYAVLRSEADLVAAQALLRHGQILVQEYVEGQGAGVGLLLDAQGEIKARVAYRRVREYPLSGGPSTLAETIHDQSLIDAAHALARGCDASNGVVHVEFKLTQSGPCVMEINPRLWGTVRLAEYAGQPFVERWLAVVLGRNMSNVSLEYKARVKARSLGHDLKLAASALKHGRFGVAACVARDLLNPCIKPLVFAGDDIHGSLSSLIR